MEKIKFFWQKNFVRNVVTLQAGSFFGNAIQALVGILLARLLQPELFGVYALAFGLASATTLIIGMGIQEATSSLLGGAYAQKDKKEVEDILGFMFKITCVATLLVIILISFLPSLARLFYGNSLIGIYASIVVVAVILSSFLYTLLYTSFQVAGKIKALTFLIVSDQVLRYGLSLLFVVFGLGVAGAMGGHLAGAVMIFISAVIVFKKFRENFEIFPSLKNIIISAKRISIKKYLHFKFWVALDRNISNLYGSLPIILTGIFVSASDVAFFKVSLSYINLALSLLGPISILLNAEFPKMKTLENNRMLLSNFKKISFYSLGLSIVLTAGAIIVSPFVINFIYGENFSPSIKYSFGLFIYGALFGIGVGLGPMWRAVNKVRISIMINVLTLGIGIPIGLALIKWYGLWGAIVMVTLWFTVSHFLSFAYLYKYLKAGK